MTEELNELKMRVGDIDKTLVEVKALMAMRESRAEGLYAKVDKIYDCLIGNGEPDKPSVILRLDRVEQILLAVKWVCAAVILLIVNAIFEYLKHG